MLIVTSTLATTSFCAITPVLFSLLFICTISKLTFILPGFRLFLHSCLPSVITTDMSSSHNPRSLVGLLCPHDSSCSTLLLHGIDLSQLVPGLCALLFWGTVSHSPGYQKMTLFSLFKRKALCAALLKHCSPFTGPVTMMWDSSMPEACPFFIFVWVVNSLGNRLSVQSVLIQTYRWFFALAYDTELFCCCSSALALVLEAPADSCILLTYFHCCMFRSCVPVSWPYKILHAQLARLLPQFWKEFLHDGGLRNQDQDVSCAWRHVFGMKASCL